MDGPRDGSQQSQTEKDKYHPSITREVLCVNMLSVRKRRQGQG